MWGKVIRERLQSILLTPMVAILLGRAALAKYHIPYIDLSRALFKDLGLVGLCQLSTGCSQGKKL